jgi:bifunctional oligoribonuclease and PAP phosphatase NrnA
VDPQATIARVLASSDDTLIVCHVNPDGDCLGAGLALAQALRGLGRRVTVGSSDGVPAALHFLPGVSDVITRPGDAVSDTAVTMECTTVDRAGVFEAAVRTARTIVAIDHHAERPSYAHHVDWDPGAAAVGEQVTSLIARLGVDVDRSMATNLLTALVTDTGVFRYANTTPRALRLAATLVEAGGSISDIVEAVYEAQSPSSMRLLGAALTATTLHAEGTVAATVITPAMMARAGAGSDETSGIASALRTIAGVRVALMFEQRAETVRVSIRSRYGARADEVARALGGGGHPAAAGAESRLPLDEVVRIALDAASREAAGPAAAS